MDDYEERDDLKRKGSNFAGRVVGALSSIGRSAASGTRRGVSTAGRYARQGAVAGGRFAAREAEGGIRFVGRETKEELKYRTRRAIHGGRTNRTKRKKRIKRKSSSRRKSRRYYYENGRKIYIE